MFIDDNLFEVFFAVFADVFVDGHRLFLEGIIFLISIANEPASSAFAGGLNAKSFGGASFGFCGFFFAIFRRGASIK